MAGLCEVCADSVTKSVCRSVCRSVRVCQPLIGNSRGHFEGLPARRLTSLSLTHPAVAIAGRAKLNTTNSDSCTSFHSCQTGRS